jgi:molybdopterin-binding protein
MEVLRLPDAARELGVSYPTLKQWIYHKKLRSIKTPGGHHRVPRAELDRLLFQSGPRRGRAGGKLPAHAVKLVATPNAAGLEHIISGRNQLVGRITSVEIVGLLAKVTLDVCGQRITSIITREACRDLRLKAGEAAAALIKATEVMIIRPVGQRG